MQSDPNQHHLEGAVAALMRECIYTGMKGLGITPLPLCTWHPTDQHSLDYPHRAGAMCCSQISALHEGGLLPFLWSPYTYDGRKERLSSAMAV